MEGMNDSEQVKLGKMKGEQSKEYNAVSIESITFYFSLID